LLQLTLGILCGWRPPCSGFSSPSWLWASSPLRVAFTRAPPITWAASTRCLIRTRATEERLEPDPIPLAYNPRGGCAVALAPQRRQQIRCSAHNHLLPMVEHRLEDGPHAALY
jgi:hypothetical protein